MAIDFPPNAVNPNPPSNGDTYVDSASGTEWEYNATNNSWTIVNSSAPGGGAFVYIGEHNFTQAAVPSPPAEAGYVYSQSDIGNAPGNVNGVYNGIAGDTIIEGTLVLYTGSSWTFMSTTPGYPNLGDGNGDTLDTRYVKLAGTNTAQTITGTGGLKTEGLLESASGVRVTGGDENFGTGLYLAGSIPSLRLAVNRNNTIRFEDRENLVNVIARESVATAGNLRILFANFIETDFTGRNDVNAVYTKFESQVDVTGTCDSYHAFRLDRGKNGEGFATNAYGFYSDLNDDSSSGETFNISIKGDAPNFLLGSTYIGGDTARNTLELWKSTLTEEQLEQFEAGTFVAPANVTNPGDGEFARQWYYDQQDEETQAALDAGTIEYPTHLAAATFTDTFDLGENTNINLLSTGDAYYRGDVEIGTNNNTGVVMTSPNGTKYRLVVADDGSLSTTAV